MWAPANGLRYSSFGDLRDAERTIGAPYMTQELPAKTPGVSALFEEAYRQFAPLMRKIAVKKFGIPLAEAEPLVFDVFAAYITCAYQVNNVGGYLISGFCDAARDYRRRADEPHRP